MHRAFAIIALFMFACCGAFAQTYEDTTAIAWRQGNLDIHHILNGSGNSTFFVLPDGTTLLVDAGDIGDRALRKGHPPLASTPPYPDGSKTAGQWIVDYIGQVLPGNEKPVIDYALITHFHDDHMGAITAATKQAPGKPYLLTGITEVGDLLPIRKLIDRACCNYDFPVDLHKYYHKERDIFPNYQHFINYQKKATNLTAQPLMVGSSRQIVLAHHKDMYPGFRVVGVKANGTIWTGRGDSVTQYFTADSVLDNNGKFNENPLSLAIKLSYGKFDYFTGGDNTGLQGFGMPRWFDVETPMAQAVGKVEVTTLDHHGCRDAVNETFLRCTQPQTVVQQSWSTNHPGEEVLHRMIGNHIYHGQPDIFATNIQDATKATLGFWLTDNYKSTFGHIIIRVLDGGEKYYVLIAETVNGKVSIKKVFGPYMCH